MALVPDFLLKKLYLQGSLANRGDGFVFALKNTLARGTATGFTSLKIDSEEAPRGDVTVSAGDASTSAAAITSDNPMPIPLNVPIEFHVAGRTLAPGPHTIRIALRIRELGDVSFEVSDKL